MLTLLTAFWGTSGVQELLVAFFRWMTRMNDPWDVKCVRQAGQYVSCMKINGVPLLPPVLSKECRKEMQYYKLLAKEVDKRISLLQPFVAESESESEDKTDAPELPECEYELPHQEVKAGYNAKHRKKSVDSSPRHTPSSPRKSRVTDVCNNISSNVVLESIETRSRSNSPKLIIDLSLTINNETEKKRRGIAKRAPRSPQQIDLPERDYNCTTRITQKVITEKEVITETQRNKKQKGAVPEIANFGFNLNNNNLIDPFGDISVSQDGPASLSSKSFTGSLNDLHRDSLRDLHNALPLTRQRSYTLLNPSPQLLAHLEVQSLNTGVEMSSISMSESLSNLSPSKKRRSWDLESAKVKWSSMALELKQNKANGLNRDGTNKSFVKQHPKNSPTRGKSVAQEKPKRTIITPKPMVKSNPTPSPDPLPKSEPIPKTRKTYSPVRKTSNMAKDPGSPKTTKKIDPLSQSHEPPPLISESEDPAARVRELYDKIQNQQLLQMASLVEKQKREQMLLQQVFEEQNNLLFKQLKTICPTSPIEVKEAWGDKRLEQCEVSDRGPVSLSQLINYKSPDQSSLDSPVSNTLINTKNYINHCDNVLKKSRDITGSIKKQPIQVRSQNGTKIMSPRTQPEGCRTRTQSPKRIQERNPTSPQRNTPASRRLNYETSASSDRDYEPMLTDRTNDTMADLNVTFPSDNEDGNFYDEENNSIVTRHIYGTEIKTIHATSEIRCSSADTAIRNMERTIHNSENSTNSVACKVRFNMQATPRERAAATKIVALAKGYLVRRLMRTDRVQATVQTIKDALLCALQLHQDREGIRGADVDLHRRLIQQITAACYSLHDTFVASTAAERCAMITADRMRRQSLAARQLSNTSSFKQTDLMSQSHTGAFPARTTRPPTASLMTQSNYETFSEDKSSGVSVSRHMASPHRRPWR